MVREEVQVEESREEEEEEEVVKVDILFEKIVGDISGVT